MHWDDMKKSAYFDINAQDDAIVLLFPRGNDYMMVYNILQSVVKPIVKIISKKASKHLDDDVVIPILCEQLFGDPDYMLNLKSVLNDPGLGALEKIEEITSITWTKFFKALDKVIQSNIDEAIKESFSDFVDKTVDEVGGYDAAEDWKFVKGAFKYLSWVKKIGDVVTGTLGTFFEDNAVYPVHMEANGQFVLDKDAVTLGEGESVNVRILLGSGLYSCESSDEKVATAKGSYDKVEITGVDAGTATITVRDRTLQKTVEISVHVTGIQSFVLAESVVSVPMYKDCSVTIERGDGPFHILGGDENIAVAKIVPKLFPGEKNKVVISGVSEGNTTFYVYNEATHQSLPLTVKVTAEKVTVTDERIVDLGLSVNWANCNVGADEPQEYGDYFAWGEVESKDVFSPNNYKYYSNGKFKDIGSDISGTQYDAATHVMGKDWRMPTKAEYEELISKCEWKFITYRKVRGWKVTGPSGNSIFLPATGYVLNDWNENESIDGFYWSSNITDNLREVYTLFTSMSDYKMYSNYMNRFEGRSIRAVTTVGDGNSGSVKVDPKQIDFGKVEYNTTKKETFRITNDGSAKVTIKAVYQGNEEISITDNGKEFTLSSGDSKVYTVTCKGMLGGKEAIGKVIITSSDGKVNQNISLTAEGAPPTTFTLEKTFVNVIAGSIGYVNILFGSKDYSISNSNTDVIGVRVDTDNRNYPYGCIALLAMDEGQSVVKITDKKEKKTINLTVNVKEDVSNPFISFVDAEVEKVCLQNWDINGDGKLSKKEAAEVDDLNGVFMNNRRIKSFPELRYFTGISMLDLDFCNCNSLRDIILPKNLESLYWNTFLECDDLKNIHIPQNVSYIDQLAFQWCVNLGSVTVSPSNTTYDSRDNCNAIIETSTNAVNNGFFTTKIPNSVKSINNDAFWGQDRLTILDLPSSITEIGEDAFGFTSLKEVTIPSSVVNIGGGLFAGCNSLKKITVAAGNSVYDSREDCNAIINSHTNELMQGCQTSFIPSTVSSIAQNAFRWLYDLEKIDIPESVTKIGGGAFYGCHGLEEIFIPSTVTSIGNGVFGDCYRLSEVVVSPQNSIYDSRNNSNTIIETATNTLLHANAHSQIPSGIKTIAYNALAGYDSRSLTIPEGVTTIDGAAFRGSDISSLTLPSTLTYLGYGVFWECGSFDEVVCYAKDVPYLVSFDYGDQTFNASYGTLRVPALSLDDYRNAPYWQDFGSIVALPQSTIKVAPTTIDFGEMERGKEKTEYFTVSNTGEGVLIFHIEGGGGRFSVADANTTFILQAGESKNFAITCHCPQETPLFAANEHIFIVSDATNAEEFPYVDVSMYVHSTTPFGVSSNQVNLKPGNADRVRLDAGYGNYTISSSNPEVVTAEIDGEDVVLTAVRCGTAIITIKDNVTGQTATIEVSVTDDNHEDIPAEAIDLGLPSGTRWAAYNIGATKPEETGGQYAWGEIETKEEYTSDNYLYNHKDLGSNICGTEYDVANVKWGGNWQMPTRKQFEELINKCSHELVEVNGVTGMRFTGPNGASVFFPFNVHGRLGAHGSYRSGTADGDDAYDLFIRDNGSVSCFGGYRYMDRAIRPVDVSLWVPPTLTIIPEQEKINFGVVMEGTDKTEILTVKNTSKSDVTFYVDFHSDFNYYFEVSDNMKKITLSSGESKDYTVIAHGYSAGYGATTTVYVRTVGSDEVTKVVLNSLGNDGSPLVDKTSMMLKVGEKGSVKLKASWIKVESDNTDIIDYIGGGSGTSGGKINDYDSAISDEQMGLTFTALKVGVAYVTFTDPYTNQTALLTIVISENDTYEAAAVPIDLVLPSGNLWASFNVGAKAAEDKGDYFAWGEIEPKQSYSWSNYIHCDGTRESLHDIGSDIQGTEYDVVHVKWGGDWVMPNNDDISELITHCSSESILVNGVNCLKFTGSNGQYIYLPDCEYWSSQLQTVVPETAYYWGAGTLEKKRVSKSSSRYAGKTIRPILKP